ncbi:MAG: helix-turn-helix domain-containing protein [Ktedonobacteraceae bacterium]
MNDTARDYQTIEPAAIDGLEDLFGRSETLSHGQIPAETVEIPAETNEIPQCLTVSELVKRSGIPRSTVYRHVRSGKYETVRGPDGKLRIPLRKNEIPVLSHEILDDTLTDTVSHDEILAETRNGTTAANVDVADLLRKLEGATYRIGYLEAQLEAERSQVKLLTDSLHKPSRWAQFKKWFFGQ